MTIVKWIGIAFITLILLLGLLISLMNWNWVRDIAAQQISDMTNRKFTINGELDINWSLTPRINIEKIQFENASWSKHPIMFKLAELDLRIDLIELLKGRVVLPEIILINPRILLEKSAKGKPNWEIQTDEADPEDRTNFPIIEHLRIEDGHLGYLDLSTATDILATFATINGQAGGEETTEFQAKGKFNGRPLNLKLNAGPLVTLREAEIPYPLTLDLQAGRNSIKVDGTLVQPLELKDFDLYFVVQSPNPEQLEQILGLPLPSLPPYQFEGKLSDNDNILQIKDLSGQVGDSDMVGDVSVNLNKEQILITADLTSQNIDLDDFAPIIGLAPGTGPGETSTAAQKREAKKEAASPFVFPREPIDFEGIRKINANITLRSKHVESKLPVDDFYVQAIIDNGHLILAPLDFGVAAGSVRSRVEIDTRVKPIKSKVETEIRHVRLSEVLNRFEISDESAGLVGGQATFWFKGDSIAEMLSSADGGLLMLMTGGQFDDLMVELAGLDIGETLVALFSDEKDTEINCAFVDLPTQGGVMNMSTLVVDTEDTVFLGKGSIDFNNEQLDLIIDPKPKDLSLFSARAPLHIEGSLKKPTFTPGATAILRGAASLALLPSAPIAGLYSLLQSEQEEQKDNTHVNVHCSGLVDAINEARE